MLDGRRTSVCLALAVAYEGAEIVTSEGLAEDGGLHPLHRSSLGEAKEEARRDGKLVLVYLWHHHCGGSATMGRRTYPDESAGGYLERHFVPVRFNTIQGATECGGLPLRLDSKGAVRLMSYALAGKLGPRGIRVNTIHPGLIETAMTTEDVPRIRTRGESVRQTNPLRRYGEPEDIAGAAVYPASDLASYVNGESLVVDGGQTNAS